MNVSEICSGKQVPARHDPPAKANDLHGSLPWKSPPPPRYTWADQLLADTAPPPAASFGALREWAWYVVLASLDGQSHETIKAIHAALRRRLTGCGFGKAETALLMDPPARARQKASTEPVPWDIGPALPAAGGAP